MNFNTSSVKANDMVPEVSGISISENNNLRVLLFVI